MEGTRHIAGFLDIYALNTASVHMVSDDTQPPCDLSAFVRRVIGAFGPAMEAPDDDQSSVVVVVRDATEAVDLGRSFADAGLRPGPRRSWFSPCGGAAFVVTGAEVARGELRGTFDGAMATPGPHGIALLLISANHLRPDGGPARGDDNSGKEAT